MSIHTGLLEAVSVFPPWQQVILILGTSVVLAKLVEVVGVRTIRHFTELSESELDDLLLRVLHAPLYVTIVLGGVYVSVQLLEYTEFGKFIADASLTFIILLWAHAINRFGNEAVDVLQDEDVAQDIAPLASNVLSVFLVVGVGFLVLTIWEINVTPFIASAGVLGIIVGFAAREALANFIGGIALYFDDTYRVGDVIMLESSERGVVQNVGIRSTTVLTRDNVLVTIPNSVLNNARVVNQSAPEHKTRVRIPISVAYGTDLDRLDEIINEICEKHDHVLDTPSPRFYLLEFGDNALEFELRVYTEHPLQEKRVQNDINRLVYERFNDEHMEIPFPQRTIHYADDEELPQRSTSVAHRHSAATD